MTENNTEYLKKVGARIRDLREAKGVTQDDLAAALGMVRTAVVKFEMGAQDFKSETVAKLSDYFGVSADYLLRGASSAGLDVFRLTGLNQAALDTLAEERDVDDMLGLGRTEVLNEILSDKDYHYLIYDFAVFRTKWRELQADMKAQEAEKPKTFGTSLDLKKQRERADFLHWQFTQKMTKYYEKLLGEK
jgi:transcriptional regulator with XRE-family HTH domain